MDHPAAIRSFVRAVALESSPQAADETAAKAFLVSPHPSPIPAEWEPGSVFVVLPGCEQAYPDILACRHG